MLLPGPEAQQLATYIGWLLHGSRGGVIAGTLFVLPGFVVIVAFSAAYALFHEANWLESLFFGLKAAVLAIVVEAVIRVGRRALRNNATIGLAAAAFLALSVFNLPFPLVVLGAGIVGYLGSRFTPGAFTAGGPGAAAADWPSVIGEGFPEAKPGAAGVAGTVVGWVALWIAPLVLIGPLLGWSSVFATLWLFFSQMAVVTFGGAYAVLAFVAQEAVQHFGWLQPGEMIDGLALAETTPGPLVLVLSFVGFLAAFRAPAGLDPLLAGVLGATLTTWVTFVPCFLWIFLGAPHIERLRSSRALSGALTAITAAVVGVILNLALWFGLHVLFREVGVVERGAGDDRRPGMGLDRHPGGDAEPHRRTVPVPVAARYPRHPRDLRRARAGDGTVAARRVRGHSVVATIPGGRRRCRRANLAAPASRSRPSGSAAWE